MVSLSWWNKAWCQTVGKGPWTAMGWEGRDLLYPGNRRHHYIEEAPLATYVLEDLRTLPASWICTRVRSRQRNPVWVGWGSPRTHRSAWAVRSLQHAQLCGNGPVFPRLTASAHSATARLFAYMKGSISLYLSGKNNKKIENSRALASFTLACCYLQGELKIKWGTHLCFFNSTWGHIITYI